MAKARFWFLNPIDALDAQSFAESLLGSVVEDYQDPQWKRFPKPGKLFPCDREERPIVELSDIELHRKYGRSRAPGGGLTSLADVQRSKTHDRDITLNAKKMTYRRLIDPQQVFQDLHQDAEFIEAVRPWCNSKLSSASACMIVGLLILDNATVEALEEEIMDWRMETTIPIGSAALALVGAPPIDVGDPKLSYSINRDNSSELKGQFKKAKILGLEYRWIHRWMGSKTITQAKTGPTGPASMYLSGDEPDAEEDLELRLGEEGDDWSSILLEPGSPNIVQLYTCSFAELAIRLDSVQQNLLEQATYASLRGRHNEAKALLQELEASTDEPVILLEKCLALERMGHFHDAFVALQQALARVESLPSGAISEKQIRLLKAFISIKSAHATIRTQGLLQKALLAAKRLRETLRDVSSRTSLSSLEVQCILSYHDVIDDVRKFSNWAKRKEAHIFSDADDEVFAELDTLASIVSRDGAFDESCALLRMLSGVATNIEDQKVATLRIQQEARKLGQQVSSPERFLAAHWLLRAGVDFHELGELVSAHECLEECCHILSLLAIEETNTLPATQTHPETGLSELEAWLQRQTHWATIFPRQHLHARILKKRLEGIRNSSEYAELANDAHLLGERAVERQMRMAARSLALTRFRSLNNPESLQDLRLQEARFLESERSGKHVTKLFLAAALIAIFSGYHALPVALAWREIQGFLSNLGGYDVPSSLYSVYSIAGTVSRPLGASPQDIESFLKKATQYYRQCSMVKDQQDQNESLHSLVWYYQQVNPPPETGSDAPPKTGFNPLKGYAQFFERCLSLIQRWAAELIQTNQLSAAAWSAIMYPKLDGAGQALSRLSLATKEAPTSDQGIVEESNLALRKELLGRYHDEGGSPSGFWFDMVPRAQWLSWIESVGGWLLTSKFPPLEEGRHYVLKMLVDAIEYCANQACMVKPPQRGMATYERLLAKLDAENHRLKIYNLLNKTIIGPQDLMVARSGVILTTVLLALSSEAVAKGAVNIQALKEAKMEALVLAQEKENNGRIQEQHYYYGVAAHACFFVYKLAPSEGLDNDIWGIFERMERCRHTIRRRETLASASSFLQKEGFSVVQPMTAALVNLSTDFTLILSACVLQVELSSVNIGGDPKALRTYPLRSSSSDEEQRALTAVKVLTNWTQRLSGQVILDIVKNTGSIIPQAILTSISISEKAQRLLDRELELTNQAEESILSAQIDAFRELDICLTAQSREPALAEYIQWRQSLAMSFDDIQAILQECGEDIVLVNWYSCNWPEDHSVYIQTHRLGHWHLPRRIEGLNALDLEGWRQTYVDVAKPFSKDKKLQTTAFNKLVSLVNPLVNLTQAKETLVLCPFGKLHGIPLHAIPVQNDLTLIERNPVIYCQNFAQFRHALAPPRPGNKEHIKASMVCSLGDKDANGDDFPPDIMPSKVIPLLVEKIPNLKAINQVKVSKIEAFEHVCASDLLVLLGHVDFQASSPMLSAFHLTATATVDLNSSETRLSATDIFNTLMQPHAVVLQLGCESGVTQVSSSGDHLGLNTAFLAAGASTIVSTLWKTTPEDAVSFLKAFVTFWMEESRNAAADDSGQLNLARVFQRAVLSLKNVSGKEEEFRDWTAFTLHGSFLAGPLTIKRDKETLDGQGLPIG